MTLAEELQRLLIEYPANAPDPVELNRLGELLTQWREAGLVKPRQYDIPHPDTIGYPIISGDPTKNKIISRIV